MKTKFLVSAALLAVALGVRPAAAVEFWSVDIQGAGSDLFGQSITPFTMAGADPTFNLGNVWNSFNVAGHALPAAETPTLSLLDRDGAASATTFTVTVPVAGWGGVGAAGGANDLFRDYMFVQAGNSPVTADFAIGGLIPGATYDMINFGGIARDALITVDVDGNADLTNDTGRIAPVATGAAIRGIVANDGGHIIGRVADGTGDPEGNWAGFHLLRAPPPGSKLWSVDIHGAGSNLFGQDVAPAQKSGIESQYGLGNVWNHAAVPGYDLDPAPISVPLADSEGNATSVEFNITTPVQGWGGDPSMGVDPLRRDYLFAQAGRSPQNIAWNISGLEAGHIYEMFAYSGANRQINLSIDQTGETASFLGAHLFGNIAADANGMISGVAFGTGTEANWSGFQLRDVTPVPEPATWALVGTAGIALLAFRRRRA